MNEKIEFELTPEIAVANAFYYLSTKAPSRHYAKLENIEFYYKRLRASAYFWGIRLIDPKSPDDVLNFILSRPDIFHYFKQDKLIVLDDSFNPTLLYNEFLDNIPTKIKYFLDAESGFRSL